MNATTAGPRPRRYASVTVSPFRVSVSSKAGSEDPSCLIVDGVAAMAHLMSRPVSTGSVALILPRRGPPPTRTHEEGPSYIDRRPPAIWSPGHRERPAVKFLGWIPGRWLAYCYTLCGS